MLSCRASALGLSMLLALASGCGAGDTVSQKPAEPASPTGTAAPVGGEEPGAAPAPSPTAACATPAAGTVVDVSVSDLKALVDAKAKIAVVDVREPSETAAGTIEGALLYPWNGKVLEAKHTELPTDRPIYVVCRSGSRSSAATAFLADKGRACIHDVQGGMNAWTAASYPTVTQ
jgi:rhodanese-related sulfurtransferase